MVKLIKFLYDKHKAQGDRLTFQDLVELVIAQLEGAFSFLFKSVHFPGELAATRRGSPLLIGVKCDSQLATNHIPIVFSKGTTNIFLSHTISIIQLIIKAPKPKFEANKLILTIQISH